MNSHSPTSKFSQEIKALLEQLAHQPLTLGNVLDQTSERGFSLVIGLLVLPFLFPMPPGLTTIFGSACLLLSLQMTLGRRTPWLPKRVAQYQFPPVVAQQILSGLRRVTRFTERFLQQINGACISWLTLLLMLPVPMTNPIPAVGILIVAIATLEADGLVMCLGYVATGLTTAFFGLIGYGLWRSPELIMRWFS
jgi:hypothetical protein